MIINTRYRNQNLLEGEYVKMTQTQQYIWHVSVLSNYWSIKNKGLLLNDEGRVYAHQFLIDPHRMWPLIWQAIFLPADVVLSYELSLLIVRIDTSLIDNKWMVDYRMNEFSSMNKLCGINDNQGFVYSEQSVPITALRIYRLELEPLQPEMISASNNGVHHFLPNPDYKELRSLMGITLYLTPVRHD